MLNTTILVGRITTYSNTCNLEESHSCSVIFDENKKKDYRRVRVVTMIGKRVVYDLRVDEETYKELYQLIHREGKEPSVANLDEIDWKTYVLLSQEYIVKKDCERDEFEQSLRMKIKKFAEDNKEIVDWNNPLQRRYCIEYDYNEGALKVAFCAICMKDFIFFTSKRLAREAIKKYHKELLQYFNIEEENKDEER